MARKHPAFALNELTAALVVIVGLSGLLLHTVQRVLVASEHTRCKNRVEQARPRVVNPRSPRTPRPAPTPSVQVPTAPSEALSGFFCFHSEPRRLYAENK